MTTEAYILFFFILLCLEILYIRIAKKLRITSLPCERSSHTRPTVTGGGIIFYFAIVIWFIASGFSHPLFFIGATLLATVSYADDLRPLGVALRMGVQFVAVCLALADISTLSSAGIVLTAIALVVGVAFLNSVNFMDGINGMTGGYVLLTLSALLYEDTTEPFMSESLLIISIIAAAIFCFFNFRRNAVCFAGDVGSITAGFILLYAVCSLLFARNSLAPIVFVAVYGVDTTLTIIRRLLMGRNILKAHRMHLYQILSNNLRLGHIATALLYIAIQALIDLGYFFIPVNGYVYLAVVLALLTVAYGVTIRLCRLPAPE